MARKRNFTISWMQTVAVERTVKATSIEEALEMCENSPAIQKHDRVTQPEYEAFECESESIF